MADTAMTFPGEGGVMLEELLFPFCGVPGGSAHSPTSVNSNHPLVQQSQQKGEPNALKMHFYIQGK